MRTLEGKRREAVAWIKTHGQGSGPGLGTALAVILHKPFGALAITALMEAAHPGRESWRRISRSVLFPQVLRIVRKYITPRVEFNGLHPCEVGLQTSAQRIIGLL